jgi:Ribonuclease G/E
VNELLLSTRGDSPRAALVRDRKLLEILDLREDAACAAEAVHLGRAGRAMKSLGAVFVTLSGGREGFLPVSDMPEGFSPKGGDALPVQIRRPAAGGKAARLSMELTLSGRYAVLLYPGFAARASRRAEDPGALRKLAARLRPEGFGLVLRSNAEEAPEADVKSEVTGLKSRMEALLEQAKTASAPALLEGAPGPVHRLLRDLREPPARVVTDDEAAAAPYGLPAVSSPDPFGLYGVEAQLNKALARRVYLPTGGTLVLDPCEAGLVIDVNTAGDAATGGDPKLRTNLEAAAEIARLLRLRRAGGIVLIDFIDLKEERHREAVLARLREALRDDRAATEVLGFTRLGLVEMTRRRTEAALPAQRLGEGETGGETKGGEADA